MFHNGSFLFEKNNQKPYRDYSKEKIYKAIINIKDFSTAIIFEALSD